MKKIFSFILALLIPLSLSSCLTPTLTDEESNSSASTLASNKSSSNAENEYISSEKESNSENEDESNNETTPSLLAWELGEFVDEFKKPTGDKYISTTIYNGVFSNSATTNSELWATVQVTKDSIAFMLWEYGWNLVKGTFDTNTYNITVLDQNSTKHYLTGYMAEDSTRIYVSSSDEYKLLNILKKSGKVSFYLTYSKYTTSTYLFEIDTTGFSELYSQLN